MTEPLRLTVNGVESELEASPDTPLLYALRNDLGLKDLSLFIGIVADGLVIRRSFGLDVDVAALTTLLRSALAPQ